MVAPNFTIVNNNQLKATNYSASSWYDIGELNFYIPPNISSTNQIFLILKDEKNLVELIELQKVGAQTNTILYKVPLNQTFRIKNGKILISLLFLNGETGTYELSSAYAVNITFEHYELARQVYIAQQINAQTQVAYAKILAMTQENRKIYEEIKERG